MAQQTAVEYLMEQLKFTNKEAYAELHCNGEFEKAKQMEKEQKKDAYETSAEHFYNNGKPGKFEYYYNETYNW